jgi:hypothetical protein
MHKVVDSPDVTVLLDFLNIFLKLKLMCGRGMISGNGLFVSHESFYPSSKYRYMRDKSGVQIDLFLAP